MSCELALVKLSVFSAWRFTHTLSAAASAMIAASTIRSHGVQRLQPVTAAVASRFCAFAGTSGGRATCSLAKTEPPGRWGGDLDFPLSARPARHPCGVI